MSDLTPLTDLADAMRGKGIREVEFYPEGHVKRCLLHDTIPAPPPPPEAPETEEARQARARRELEERNRLQFMASEGDGPLDPELAEALAQYEQHKTTQ